MAGSVTTIRPVLCVGRYAAAGECVYGITAAARDRLQLGDCVSVLFGAPNAQGRYRLKSIKAVASKDHRQDCPT